MPMLAIISHAISQPRDQRCEASATGQDKTDEPGDVLFDHRRYRGAFDHELALGLEGISEFHKLLELGDDVWIRHYDVGSVWVLHRDLLRVDDVNPRLVAIAGDVVLRSGSQLQGVLQIRQKLRVEEVLKVRDRGTGKARLRPEVLDNIPRQR